jgi:hypothetical protein
MARFARPFAALVLLALSSPAFAQPGPVPQPPLPPVEPATALQEAARLFKLGSAQPAKFADAAKCFAAAFHNVEMSADQLAAWAYCRVRLAHDRLGKSPADAAVATEVIAEVEEALRLAPDQDKLHALGATIVADAVRRGGRAPAQAPALAPVGGAAVETANFRVVHAGAVEVATALARAAEEQRVAIHRRWTSKPPADWPVKCAVTLHATADGFARATQQPAGQRGRAATDLADGRVTARRLDLSLDGDIATLTADVLPRELSHVVLAELFPTDPPPLWAELGMAVLATSDAEQARYRTTLARCADAGTLLPPGTLMKLKAAPAERTTEFHVESASLVYFFAKWRGEAEFVSFLSLARRYGPESAARQVYGVESLAQLDAVWKKAASIR